MSRAITAILVFAAFCFATFTMFEELGSKAAISIFMMMWCNNYGLQTQKRRRRR